MRILLADGQPNVRFALRVLLDREPGYHVVGEASDSQGLSRCAALTLPDVVVLGWELPGLAPRDPLAFLRRECPHLIIIALSARAEARSAALSAGANAFVSKSDPPEQLLAAIDRQRPGPDDDPLGTEKTGRQGPDAAIPDPALEASGATKPG